MDKVTLAFDVIGALELFLKQVSVSVVYLTLK